MPSKISFVHDCDRAFLLEYREDSKLKLVFSLLKYITTLGDKEKSGIEEIKMVYDTRTCVDSQWVGVVLRHIPKSKDMKRDILSTLNKTLVAEQ
jgi:hypothetical protein